VDDSQGSERRADRASESGTGSAETARCNLFLPTGLPAGGLAAARASLSFSCCRGLVGDPEQARPSVREGVPEGAVDRDDLGKGADEGPVARASSCDDLLLGSASTFGDRQ